MLTKNSTKPDTLARYRRRLLTLGERLRGWVEIAVGEELRDERRSTTRRALGVVRAFARHGLRVHPISGVEMRLEVAEKILALLENNPQVTE